MDGGILHPLVDTIASELASYLATNARSGPPLLAVASGAAARRSGTFLAAPFRVKPTILLLLMLTALSYPAAAQTRLPITVNVQVTDRAGAPLEGALVTVEGPSDREGKTPASGRATFLNVSAGVYRVRIEHQAFITLEKDLVVRSGVAARVEAALSPARSTPARASAGGSPVGLVAARPITLSIPDLVEKEYISREPLKETVIGCSGSSETRLIQVREPLTVHTHPEADETLYMVAGDATLKVGDVETPIVSGWFSIVPRGMPHAITRKGRNPVILLSTVSGMPCTARNTLTTP